MHARLVWLLLGLCPQHDMSEEKQHEREGLLPLRNELDRPSRRANLPGSGDLSFAVRSLSPLPFPSPHSSRVRPDHLGGLVEDSLLGAAHVLLCDGAESAPQQPHERCHEDVRQLSSCALEASGRGARA